jgi:hypothetical protein
MEPIKAVCRCAPVSEARACASDSPLRRIAETGINVCGVILQIGAPKCAVCWTTYAGLINVGWFAAESANPLWLAFGTLTLIISLAAGLQRALQTRRYVALLATTVAWILLVAGWFTGLQAIRYAGFALLSISFVSDRFARRISGTSTTTAGNGSNKKQKSKKG